MGLKLFDDWVTAIEVWLQIKKGNKAKYCESCKAELKPVKNLLCIKCSDRILNAEPSKQAKLSRRTKRRIISHSINPNFCDLCQKNRVNRTDATTDYYRCSKCGCIGSY